MPDSLALSGAAADAPALYTGGLFAWNFNIFAPFLGLAGSEP